MDITPQVINEVEFHQKMRGYDPDEVDDFLERIAVAVATLHERLQEAASRVTQAERRSSELEQRLRSGPAEGQPAPAAPTGEDETDVIRRTLVLAQRTADAAIKEAEEAAQRTVEAAQEQANQIYREAQEHAQNLVATAEAEARRSADDTRQRLVAEIITLEQTRDALRSDHGVLAQHVEDQRARVRAAIADLEQLLEDPSRLHTVAPPPTSDIAIPDFVEEDTGVAPAPADEVDDPAPVLDLAAEPAPAAAEPVAEPVTGGVLFTSPEPAEVEGNPLASSIAAEDEAWARFVGDEGGPPTEAIRLDEAGDDAYLAELRKAMLDDGDEELLPAQDPRRPRFGRRR